jgi:tryptophan-rich sensory protein
MTSPSHGITRPRALPGAARSLLVLGALLVISFSVAALGTLAAIPNIHGWYSGVEKATWTPPNAVFGPVWTVLYVLMAVAAWLVWRERYLDPLGQRRALTAYVVQLVLNAIWTPVFFGLYPAIGAPALWIAFGIILALDAAVLVTLVRFWPVQRVAAALLIPYLAWVLYATTLNAAIAVFNS